MKRTQPEDGKDAKKIKLSNGSDRAGLVSLGHLPEPAIRLICQSLSDSGSKRSLASLAAAGSASIRDIAIPILYSRLVLTRNNADRLFRGMERKKPTKKRNRVTQKQRDAELRFFQHKFKDLFDYDEENMDWDGGDWPRGEWVDSEPETDDELPPLPEIKEAAVGCTWERRKQLLEFCKHLTIAQCPSLPFMEDLLDVVGDPGWHGDEDPELDSDDEGEEGVEMLFPNASHLSLSGRVVRYIADYNHVNFFFDIRHPFNSLLRLIPAKHVCLTTVPGAWSEPKVAPEHIFRWISLPVNEITEKDVKGIMDQYEENHKAKTRGSIERVTMCMHKSFESLTVHNVRHAGSKDGIMVHGPPGKDGYGLPVVLPATRGRRKYRYFYDEQPPATDSVAGRIGAVAGVLELSASTPSQEGVTRFEHIDVGRNVYDQAEVAAAEQSIKDGVHGIIATDLKYRQQEVGTHVTEEDKDRQAEAERSKAWSRMFDVDRELRKLKDAQKNKDKSQPFVDPAMVAAQKQSLQAEKVHTTRSNERNAAKKEYEKVLKENGVDHPETTAAKEMMDAADKGKQQALTAWRKVRGHFENKKRTAQRVPRPESAAEDEAIKTLEAKLVILEEEHKAAESRAKKLAEANRIKRLATDAVVAPPPEERVRFTREVETEGCVVCGRKCVDNPSLKALIDAAYGAK